MAPFRSADELLRAKWAGKYASVAEGALYVPGADGRYTGSPFPYHRYFQNRLLGPNVRMLEVNAGHALVEHLVTDTVTELKIQVGDGQDTDEQEIREWIEETDYMAKLEEAARDFYANGFGAQQPIRTDDEETRVGPIDPSTWYPTVPTFTYQDVAEGRLVCVFDEGTDGKRDWYAFVEIHTVGNVRYELYRIDDADSLDGTKVAVNTLKRFEGLEDADTDVDSLAVFTAIRKPTARHPLGQSVLAPIWGLLQEVSQVQTHIRHEIIKHSKAKMYADKDSLQRAAFADTSESAGEQQLNSKQAEARTRQVVFNAMQEIFPVQSGGVVPGYIQRDLQFIEKGSLEIDRVLGRIAAVAGCPKAIFNLDESSGNVKVEVEKRKDRRYMAQVFQGQKRVAALAQKMIGTWWKWQKGEEAPNIKCTFASPFELSREETVALMRDMNATADFVSTEEALKHVWPEMKPEEREQLIAEIRNERRTTIDEHSPLAEAPNNLAL